MRRAKPAVKRRPGGADEPVIRTRRLTKRYGSLTAVDNLDIRAGIIVLDRGDNLLDLIAHPQDRPHRVLHDCSGMSYSTVMWSSGWRPAAATVSSAGSRFPL